MEGIQVVTQDFVNVHITKSDSDDAAPVERRFKKGITVLEFKVIGRSLFYTFIFFYVFFDKFYFQYLSVIFGDVNETLV